MHFEVRRDDLHQTRFTESSPPEITDGEALLTISRFGLSANNITYGVLGDAMNYWDFFPGSEEAWGRIPVWGFADVEASEHPDVEAGRRVYGFLPPSDHLVVKPDRVDDAGFLDSASHRRELSAVYNHYEFTDADAGYEEGFEDQQMLLRPLFGLSFLLDDELAEEESFGAETAVLSSASSKTALGSAFLIARRDGPRVIGLTSPSRVEFVEGTGAYDGVIAYEDVGSLGEGPAVYLDFSADADVRAAVHRHYGDALARSITIGATHWTEMFGDAELPGPAPSFFFAPSRAAKRTTDWGGAGLRARLAEAWTPFVEWTGGWLEVRRGEGPEALEATYRELLGGRVDPAAGHVSSLS